MIQFETNIKSEIQKAQQLLEKTGANQHTIRKKILRTVGSGSAKAIGKQIRQSTKKKTGEASKAYVYKVKDNQRISHVTMFAYGKDKSKSIYPKIMTLNYGATILPVKGKTLLIKGRGFFARSKSVTITGRFFLQKAWSAYIESGSFTSDMQKVVDKEIEKFWGRYGSNM